MKIRELEEGIGSWLAGKLGKAAEPVKAATTPTTPLRTVSKTWPWTQGIAQAEKQGIKFVPLTAQGDLVVDIAGRPIVVVDMGGVVACRFMSAQGVGVKQVCLLDSGILSLAYIPRVGLTRAGQKLRSMNTMAVPH